MSSRRLPLSVAAWLGIALAGCGGSSGHSIPVSAKLVSVPGSKVGEVVLSPLGAQRIGVQTGKVVALHAGAGPARTAIPYSAVVYDPSGATYAFVRVAPLHYVEVRITVAKLVGTHAYLAGGPKAGSDIVSTGAEELYGVQTGVLAQT